jgi:serine phosphatase RsbU (regulator of sigma subunit)
MLSALDQDERESADNQLKLLTLLAEVSEVLSTSIEAELAVGLLAERVVPLLGDWCVISLLDDFTGQQRDIGAAHRDPDLQALLSEHARLRLRAEDSGEGRASSMAAVVATGAPVIATLLDGGLLADLVPDPVATALLRPGSAAIYPLRGRGGSFGAIALVNHIERGPHTAAELDIARLMARRAGLSLDNSRLFSRQKRIAEFLQLSMLSVPPQFDGVDLAFRYLPAGRDAHVGGDWYDAFALPDGATMLVIGDVAGHDLQAVSVMAQIRTMTRSIAYDRGAGPAELLTRVDAVLRGLRITSLCTALAVRIERRAEPAEALELTWSSAGHPVPLLLDELGEASPLRTTSGLLLGTGVEFARTEQHMRLARGHTMLLMTDGLFERRDVPYDVSVDLLGAVLAPLAALPLEELCDAVIAHAAADRPEDDIAIIALRAALPRG